MIQHSALGLAAAIVLSSSAFSQQAAPDSLLAPMAPPAATLPGDDSVTLRQEVVAVRSELLEDAAARPGATIAFRPFPGEDWRLDQVIGEDAYGGGRVFTTRVVDAAGALRGDATISVFGDAVSASVRVDRRLLRIEPAGAGAHRLAELDESAFPTCANGDHDLLVNTPPAAGTGGPAAAPKGGSIAASTNLPTVDVMVVYTTKAKNNQGGVNGMGSLINLAVKETNDAYNFVDVGQRLRLVHTEELVGYTENGNFSTELSRLRSKNDGHFDHIHPTRDAVGADEVSMIVASSQYCGIAYLMGNPSNSFASSAFSVVARTCTTGYYSFGHELGHNMGSHHDLANAGGNPSYNYSYGWRTANGAYRTIMAYAPGTRIKRFSNPNKTHNGQVLGKVNSAENWKSLNNTAPTTSQWRCAVPEPYGVPKLTSNFKQPLVRWSGKPVASGAGLFQVRIEDAEPGNTAIVFYGDAPDSAPFMGGFLWVAPPITRLAPQVLDGNGDGSWDFPITNFSPGDEVYVQGWFRDPAHPDGTGTGLTDGLRVDVCLYNN